MENKQSAQRGIFIVFEGLDRSGKSTQSKMLAEYLEKQENAAEVKKINFPDRTSKTGHLLNEYLTNSDMKLNDEAVHLLFAMNRWEKKEELIADLENGKDIVCDRYAFSGVSYSASKGLDFQWCLNADRGLIKPDLVIYIEVDMETIAERAGFGDERYEKTEFQTKVKAQYENFKEMYNNSPHWRTVQGGGKSIEQMHTEIVDVVNDYKTNVLPNISFDE